jgi:hypothetical protein
MTTIDLYRKHKVGGVSREKFLYEVRRDNNLPFITNLTSYDDAVKILKNKGIVTEATLKDLIKPLVAKLESMGYEVDSDPSPGFQTLEAYKTYPDESILRLFLMPSDKEVDQRRDMPDDNRGLSDYSTLDVSFTYWPVKVTKKFFGLYKSKQRVMQELPDEAGRNIDLGIGMFDIPVEDSVNKIVGLLQKAEQKASQMSEIQTRQMTGDDDADWMGEDFNLFKKMKDYAGEQGWTFSARRPTDEEDEIGREYMRSQGKELGSIGVDRITGNINVMEPNGDFRAILSPEGEELSAYEMRFHENLDEAQKEKDIEIDIDSAEQITLNGKELDSDKLGTNKKYRDLILKAPDKAFMYKGKKATITAVDMNDGDTDEPKIYLTILNESETKEAKADEAVKAEVKPKAVKETQKQLNADQVHPYEYRLGIQCELYKMDDYSDESLEKAKEIVLKNLNKDFNYYTNEKYAETSPYTFKPTETDKPGMQAKADGYLKKELKKNEKANVKDNLGNKEAGKAKPKGVKIMPDKGVTGTQKTIKESVEEVSYTGRDGKVYSTDNDNGEIEISDESGDYVGDIQNGKVSFSVFFDDAEQLQDEFGPEGITEDNWKDVLGPNHAFVKIIDTIGGDVEAMDDYVEITVDADKLKTIKEGSFMGGVDLGSSFDKMKQDIIGNKEDFELADENAFEDLMKKYDFYAEMSDDSRKWDAQQTMNSQLKMLAKKIGVEKAVELFNQKAPANRKVNASFFGMNEDKHAKIKEALKKALKEADIALKPVDDNIAKKETELANLYTQKANILKKPGSQT